MTGDPKDSFNLALAQLNPVVGDIEGNAEKVIAAQQETGKIVGMLSRKDLIAAYHDRITMLRHGKVEDEDTELGRTAD